MMNRNKFGTYILLGAAAGAVVSMFDRYTREQVITKTKGCATDISYYATNPDVLKSKVQEKVDKYQSVYEQFTSDATYLKVKVDELKQLTPQVKEMVVDTKDAFTESKDEYKEIVKGSTIGEDLEK